MSHVTEVKTQFKDQKCLVKALVAVGIPEADIEIHEKAVSFQTMGGTMSSGHVIIRKATLKKLGGYGWNDIGFEKMEDGTFMAAIDFDERKFGQKFLDATSQQYGVIKTKQECEDMGFLLENQEAQDNGDIVLVFEEL